jgi:hypothetical protein
MEKASLFMLLDQRTAGANFPKRVARVPKDMNKDSQGAPWLLARNRCLFYDSLHKYLSTADCGRHCSNC